MNRRSKIISGMALVSLGSIVLASCHGTPGAANGGQSAGDASASRANVIHLDNAPFEMEVMGQYDEPWAMAFEPGTGTLFITERAGTLKFRKADGTTGTVSGVPRVDYGGQGGLGDIAFAPDYATSKAIYLSWAEAGSGDTRGAVLGRATLDCESDTACTLKGMDIIWRQTPKVTGRGHYSHRLAFSPDGKYLYVASGDRQKKQPAQDTGNNLGTILRLMPDGTPAPGNPLAGEGAPSDQIWSWGHRNILGMAFDGEGQLWDLEHGPQGGDELNLVGKGANYGWPNVSNGINYDNSPIPDHSAGDGFTPPAVSWTPVIAPGDMIIYSGVLFPDWQGDAIIPGLASQALVTVEIDGTAAREDNRVAMDNRLRAIAEAPDGAIWVAEDGPDARLLRLTPDEDKAKAAN